ncbi:2-dehydropantoate 2-reductase [Sphingomonas sp. G124]|uniref:2-dehydropantoate 2-reductase n=1 Tax=Sphingomonas cremea TaxID=2904799 RepID=A0A9X1TZ94_9SPHN|nr:2-dehydropantoate 2-reductase [Sphingomonas cremea]MCF2515933.1 2-dehydropantoate 2-reductase [Sphingomonas cremea]
MKIGIIGAGAIGAWIAARLALAGNRVSILARGETLRALRDGLTVREREVTERVEVSASDNPSAIGRQDLLIIAVKAPALGDVAGVSGPMTGPETLILPMLNGVPWWFLDGEPLSSVDPGGLISQAIPLSQLVGCVVHAACRRTSPASVEVAHADKLILGEPKCGTSQRVRELAGLFENAGIRVEVSEDVRRAIWYKLWGNMTMNPLSALTEATADRLLTEPELKPFILACMAEAAAVGGAIGCPISESGEDRMAVTARLGAFKTSMLQDVEAGRRIELEALVGAPREIGRRVGVPTPSIDTLYAITRLMAESRGLL